MAPQSSGRLRGAANIVHSQDRLTVGKGSQSFNLVPACPSPHLT
jgi:hypothetical protein